jgi:hypothetical protein
MEVKDIKFKVTADIYWDNWGKMVKVFSKGQICKGKLYSDGTVTAESPYYEGVSDSVDTNCIKIL